MIQDAFWGILIPFLGTSLGAGCVFFLKKSLSDGIQRALTGFAAGVMVAASIWSLLIPAIEQSEGMGKLSFLPAFIGFWVGVLFLLIYRPKKQRAAESEVDYGGEYDGAEDYDETAPEDDGPPWDEDGEE